MQNEQKFGTGALKDIPDGRDYKAEQILGDAVIQKFNWEIGFDIELLLGYRKLVSREDFLKDWSVQKAQELMVYCKNKGIKPVKLKVENQYQSDSCVGQGVHKYAEVLQFIDEGAFTDLSAKDLFSRIATSYGAYIRDGMDEWLNYGIALETDVPSYTNEISNKEALMSWFRQTNMTPEVRERAAKFESLSYASLDNAVPDVIANVMVLNFGAVGGCYTKGWSVNSQGIIKMPQRKEGGHCMFYGKLGLVEDKPHFGIINSWGEYWGKNGWGWMPESLMTSSFSFSLWTAIDKPNFNYMEFLKQNDGKIIQETEESGTLGLIKGGKVLVAPTKEKIVEILVALEMKRGGVPVKKSLWETLPKENL